MKTEVGRERPECFTESWPGQFEFFSHFQFLGGIPSALFLITTFKDNGKPNLCFHAWSGFSGDGGGFFAVLPGLGMHTHTYRNLSRDGAFCVNFMAARHFDACVASTQPETNADEADEIAAAGFTAEPARTVKAPRIREAFLTFECTVKSMADLSGAGMTALVVGRVGHAAVEEDYHRLERICGPDGFMLNVQCPKDPRTGVGRTSAVTTLSVLKTL